MSIITGFVAYPSDSSRFLIPTESGLGKIPFAVAGEKAHRRHFVLDDVDEGVRKIAFVQARLRSGQRNRLLAVTGADHDNRALHVDEGEIHRRNPRDLLLLVDEFGFKMRCVSFAPIEKEVRLLQHGIGFGQTVRGVQHVHGYVLREVLEDLDRLRRQCLAPLLRQIPLPIPPANHRVQHHADCQKDDRRQNAVEPGQVPALLCRAGHEKHGQYQPQNTGNHRDREWNQHKRIQRSTANDDQVQCDGEHNQREHTQNRTKDFHTAQALHFRDSSARNVRNRKKLDHKR